jgi:hypothetical protein
MAFLPNPMLSLCVGAGSVTGGTNFASNSFLAYQSSPQNLFNQVLSYRVVGWGAKLLAKDTAFAEKGRVYAVVIPNTGTQPAWETLNTISATNVNVATTYILGYGLGSSTQTALQNYATCQSFSTQDLLAAGSMTMSISPSHADQFRFRGTGTSSSLQAWNSSSAVFQEGTVSVATGFIPTGSSGNVDATNLAGSNTLLIFANGLPASSNEFDVDIIMHIEATPNLSQVSGGLVPSGMDSAPGSTTTLESILARAKPITDTFRAGLQGALNNGGTNAVRFGANLGMQALSNYRMHQYQRRLM